MKPIKLSKTKYKSISNVISSSEFKDLLNSSSVIQKKPFSISIISKGNGLLVVLYGKHLSKNRINSLHFRQKLSYKNAIKKAGKDIYIIYKDILPDSPYKKVSIEYTVVNPKSRDDDANYDTLKILRDLCVKKFNIIEDDHRRVVVKSSEREVLEKDYRIEMLITPIS